MSVRFVKQPKYKIVDKTKELSQDSLKKINQKLNLSTTNFKAKLQKLFDKSNPDSVVDLFGSGDVLVSITKDKKTGGYLLNFSNLGSIDGVSIDKIKGVPDISRKMSTGTASDGAGSQKHINKKSKSVVDKSLDKAENILKKEIKVKAPKGFKPYKNLKFDFSGSISRSNIAIAGDALLQSSRPFQNIVYNAIIRTIKSEVMPKLYGLLEKSGYNFFVKKDSTYKIGVTLSGGAKSSSIGRGERTYLGYIFLPRLVKENGEEVSYKDYDIWDSVFGGSERIVLDGFSITNHMQVFFNSDLLNKKEIKEISDLSNNALRDFAGYLSRGGSPD